MDRVVGLQWWVVVSLSEWVSELMRTIKSVTVTGSNKILWFASGSYFCKCTLYSMHLSSLFAYNRKRSTENFLLAASTANPFFNYPNRPRRCYLLLPSGQHPQPAAAYNPMSSFRKAIKHFLQSQNKWVIHGHCIRSQFAKGRTID